jgi:uncharacterized protein (UPF0276 family)
MIRTGLGLRSPHYSHILENKPQISWFEAISENYMGTAGGSGGRPLEILEEVRRNYPVVLHGVSLSIGSIDELDLKYLDSLKKLIDHIEPLWVSDHVCWTGVNGENIHDLLPLPYTEEALSHLERKILQAQDFLKRELVFENVSTYLSYKHSEMTEWEFLSELNRRTGCGLLLDVNNVYVSSVNLGFDPITFLNSLPKTAIKQIHLAGHSTTAKGLIDTHDGPVCDAVWDLFAMTLSIFGNIPTLIEWDDKIPAFEVLEAEAQKAQSYMEATSEKLKSLTC